MGEQSVRSLMQSLWAAFVGPHVEELDQFGHHTFEEAVGWLGVFRESDENG